MKIYKIPEKLKTIIFDIDGTLYTSTAYVYEQVDAQIRHFAHLNGIEEEQARKRIKEFRKQWANEHEGKKISLGNTFTHFGISIETSIEWRNTLLHPEKYLNKNTKLKDSLVSLQKAGFRMVCVTNNPVAAARKTLEVIGIDGTLKDIIGLDTCFKSKPAKEVLDEACTLTDSSYEECLSVGDRYDIDLALPLDLGMGAVLVAGAEDVCALADQLCSHDC